MRNTTTRKSTVLVLTAICALPLAALADGPTSRPVGRPGGDRMERRNGPFRPGPAARAPITAEQWANVLAFMQEHSPRRAEELQTVIAAADEKKANLLKQLVAAQYDYVMSLKNEDSELYDLQINKVEAQDAIYGMLRDAGKKSMADQQKNEFRELVAKLVDVNLSERARRIEKAQKSLAKAQSTLEQDKKNKDSLVADRMDQFLKEGARPFKLDTQPAGPGGPRPEEPGAAADEHRRDAYTEADQQLNAVLMASLVK